MLCAWEIISFCSHEPAEERTLRGDQGTATIEGLATSRHLKAESFRSSQSFLELALRSPGAGRWPSVGQQPHLHLIFCLPTHTQISDQFLLKYHVMSCGSHRKPGDLVSIF